MSEDEERDRIRRWLSGELGDSFLDAFKKDGDSDDEAFEAFFAAILALLTVHPAQSLACVQRIRERDLARLSPRQRAAILRLKAHANLVCGRGKQAERLYRKAWNTFERLGLKREMASTGMNLGLTLTYQGAVAEGLSVLQRSYRAISPRTREGRISRARILVAIGGTHAFAGSVNRALRDISRAKREFERENAPYDALVTEYNYATTVWNFGRVEEARTRLQDVVDALRVIKPDAFVMLRALAILAFIKRFEGRDSEIDEELEAALDELWERGDTHTVAAVCMFHAQFLTAAGATAEAERWARRGQSLWTELEYDRGLARLGSLRARLALRRGDLSSARRQYHASLRLYERAGFRDLAARTRLDLAELDLEQGRIRSALRQLDRCRRTLQALQIGEAWVRWLHLRARCDLVQGKYRATLRRMEKARRLSTRVPERWERPWMSLTAARAALGAGDHRATLLWAQRAVESLEEMDLHLGSRHVRESIAPTREDVSRGAMDIVLRRGGPHATRIALGFLSRTRSVQLVEDLLGGTELDGALRASITRVRDDLREPFDQQTPDALAAQLKGQLESLESRLERAYRAGSAQMRRIIDARNLTTWRSSLGSRTLVFYDVDQRQPLAWIVRERGPVRRVELPLEARRAYTEWNSVRMLLDYVAHQDRSRRDGALAEAESEVHAALAELRRVLWDPLGVAPGDVVLVPSESMLELPLEASLASTDGGDAWVVTRLPHPALLLTNDRVRRAERKHALLLHDGARGQRSELDLVGQLLRRRGLGVRRASRRREFEQLGERFDVMHFAAHGAYDRRQWVGNGVKLADGWLGFEQLRRRNVRGALLFFSSCESALPSRAPCSSLDGWMTAGLGAGAREMVLTHWKIDDEAARVFSREFYASWVEHGSAALAAARARRKLHTDGVHPFRWAPFITVG